MVLSVGHYGWRRVRAREIAEQWLAQHRYRARSLRVSYWDTHPRFRLTPLRDNDWAIDFRAEVDDMRLRGTEENGGAQSPETQWVDAQLALMRRAAAGESTFRPESRDGAARAAFDTTVEHLLALNHRGLLTCATPIAELKADAQYAAVTDVELTDEGRRGLERADASPAVAGDAAI